MGRYRKAPRILIVPDRTLLSVLSSPSAKEVHHVLHIIDRYPLSEMSRAGESSCHRAASGSTRACNPILPMRRLRRCRSQVHFTEATNAACTCSVEHLLISRRAPSGVFLKSPRCMEGPRRNSDATSWDSARVLKKDRNSWHEFS